MSQPHLLMIHGLRGSIDYLAPRAYLSGLHIVTPGLLGYGSRANAVPAAGIDLRLATLTTFKLACCR
jgi:hypothetical protein